MFINRMTLCCRERYLAGQRQIGPHNLPRSCLNFTSTLCRSLIKNGSITSSAWQIHGPIMGDSDTDVSDLTLPVTQVYPFLSLGPYLEPHRPRNWDLRITLWYTTKYTVTISLKDIHHKKRLEKIVKIFKIWTHILVII